MIHPNHDLTSDLARSATHETVFNYDGMINEHFLAPINKNLSQYGSSLFAKIGQLHFEQKQNHFWKKVIIWLLSLDLSSILYKRKSNALFHVLFLSFNDLAMH